MKRLLALFVLILPIFSFAEQEVEYSVYFSKEGFGYMQLSDGSTWQVYPLELREQTWTEWWYNIEIVQPDECYLVEKVAWEKQTPVTVHHFDPTNCSLYFDDIENKDLLYDCSHTIRCEECGKCLFAKPVEFMQVMRDQKKCYIRAYWLGYIEGYAKG